MTFVRFPCVVALFAFLVSFDRAHAVDVEFPDGNLETLIREALNKPSGVLTDLDLGGLTELELDGGSLVESAKIVDLHGLQYATGLKALHLPGHKLSDLVPLVPLTSLESLVLSNNDIRSIAALGVLVELEFIDLSENRIDDCGALAGLAQVASLDLSGNYIRNVGPLWGYDESVAIDVSRNFLDLEEYFNRAAIDALEEAGVVVVYYGQNTATLSVSIDSVAFGAEEGTGTITVESNTLWSISSDSDWLSLSDGFEDGLGNGAVSFTLDSLPDGISHRLGYLSVGYETFEISQGTPLVIEFPDAVLEWHIRVALSRPEGEITALHMEQLSYLTVSHSIIFPYTAVKNLSGLEHAINLRGLSLYNTIVSNLDPIRSLPALASLDIRGSFFGHVGDLRDMLSLTSLKLYNCNLGVIPQIPNSVVRLYISGNGISDLTPLAEQTQLVTLDVGSNQISDLSPITGLVNLEDLRLGENQIRDASSLLYLESLEYLSISQNELTSIESLLPLVHLKSVGLHYNYIDFSEESVEAGRLQELVQRGVEFPNRTQLSRVGPIAVDETKFDQGGGSGVLSVASSTSWSVSTDADWITIINGKDRFEDGTVEFEVAAVSELSELRTALLKIEHRELIITQYPNVEILDPVLELAIREEIGKPSGALTEYDLDKLQFVSVFHGVDDLTEDRIHDLSGLESAHNLRQISLQNVGVSSLDPIRGLSSLISIFIDGSLVEEVGNLDELIGLESLVLANSKIEAIFDIPEWVLQLGLGGNNISDLSPLESETQLESLSLSSNSITDIEALRSLVNLRYLGLSENLVRSASAVEGLTKLEKVLFYKNHLTTIQPLLELPVLDDADVAHNYIDLGEGGEESEYLQELVWRGVDVWSSTQFFSNIAVAVRDYSVQQGGRRGGIRSQLKYVLECHHGF